MGMRWLFIPEAHIRVQVSRNGTDLNVNAFRTDGFRRLANGETVPNLEYIKGAHTFTSIVEVPEDIALFAVESERARQEAIANTENILRESVEKNDVWGGFTKFLQSRQDRESDRAAENKMGMRILAILEANTGGQ